MQIILDPCVVSSAETTDGRVLMLEDPRTGIAVVVPLPDKAAEESMVAAIRGKMVTVATQMPGNGINGAPLRNGHG